MRQRRASRRPNKAGFSSKEEARAYLVGIHAEATAEEVVQSAQRGVELAREAESVRQLLRLAKMFLKKLDGVSLPNGYPGSAKIQRLVSKLPADLAAVLASPPALLTYFKKFSQATDLYISSFDVEPARNVELQLGAHALAAAARVESKEPVTPTGLTAVAVILDVDGAGTHEQRVARWKSRMPAVREEAERLARLPSMAPVQSFAVESRT